MKNWINSRKILALLITWILISIPIYFGATRHTITQEFYILVGSWATYGTATENGITASLTANESLQQELTAAGFELVTQAGYGQSAYHLIWERYFGMLFPVLIILTVGVLLLIALTLWLCCKEEHRIAQIFQENQMLIRRVEALQTEQKQQLQEIEEYEGNLYHQWKTPLTSLELCLELLTAPRSETERQRALEGARFQTDKLSRLTRLLLREKQLSSRKVRFHYELVPLEGVVEQAIRQLELAASFRGISLAWTMPEEECAVTCDETWMTECIVAILDNAVECARGGSTVTLTLKRQREGYVLRVLSDSRLELINQSRMFRRFVSSSPGRFGIGLHMAKSVVEHLHGSISVRSTESGVCVELFLPDLHDSKAYDVTAS